MDVYTYDEQIAKDNHFYVYNVNHYLTVAISVALGLEVLIIVLWVVLNFNTTLLVITVIPVLLVPVISLLFNKSACESLTVYCFKDGKLYLIRVDSTGGNGGYLGARERAHNLDYIRILVRKIEDGTFVRNLWDGGTAKYKCFDRAELTSQNAKYDYYSGIDDKGRSRVIKIKHAYSKQTIQSEEVDPKHIKTIEDSYASEGNIPGARRLYGYPADLKVAWIIGLCGVAQLLIAFLLKKTPTVTTAFALSGYGLFECIKYKIENRNSFSSNSSYRGKTSSTIAAVVFALTVAASVIIYCNNSSMSDFKHTMIDQQQAAKHRTSIQQSFDDYDSKTGISYKYSLEVADVINSGSDMDFNFLDVLANPGDYTPDSNGVIRVDANDEIYALYDLYPEGGSDYVLVGIYGEPLNEGNICGFTKGDRYNDCINALKEVGFAEYLDNGTDIILCDGDVLIRVYGNGDQIKGFFITLNSWYYGSNYRYREY